MLVTRHLGQWRESQPRWANFADAAFQEPWGVAPYCGTWYVACYGGKEGGSICVVTPVTFAVKICELIEASPTMPSAMSHHGSSVRKLRVQGQRARRLVCMRSSRRCVCSLHHHLLISHACLSQRLLNGYPHHITSQVHTLVEYALELCRSRSTAIGGLAPDGGNGSFNRHTLGGLKYSVSNVAHVLNDLEARGVSTDSISLYAMFN